jgi:hypothetical protein
MSQLIDGTNVIELKNAVKFSKPKSNPKAGKVINITNKHHSGSLFVETPIMTAWGAQQGKDTNGNLLADKWTLSLQFPNEQYPNPEASKFLESMIEFDKLVKQTAYENSVDWFGKKHSNLDVTENAFNSMLKYPKKYKGQEELDYSKPPTLTVKLAKWTEKGWQFEIYDENGEPLFVIADNTDSKDPLQYLSSKILNLKCIIQPTIWITNGKVSITWSVKQIIVKKQNSMKIPQGKCLLSLSSNDKQAIMQEVNTLDKEEEPENVMNVHIDSEDDEEEEIAMLEPEPVVKKPVEPEPVVMVQEEVVKPVKKVIKKKV